MLLFTPPYQPASLCCLSSNTYTDTLPFSLSTCETLQMHTNSRMDSNRRMCLSMLCLTAAAQASTYWCTPKLTSMTFRIEDGL